MKKLALATVAAAALFTAVPAMAQVGFFAGPGGVGVSVAPPYWGPAPYGYGYYDYSGPGVYVAPGWRWHRHWHHWR
jgi:hypothetical protein